MLFRSAKSDYQSQAQCRSGGPRRYGKVARPQTGCDPDGETAAFFIHSPPFRPAPPLRKGCSCPAFPRESKSDSVQTASGPDQSVCNARCRRADKGYPPRERLCGKWDIAWLRIRRKPASPPIESGPVVTPQEAASSELPAQQSFVPPSAIPDRSPPLP